MHTSLSTQAFPNYQILSIWQIRPPFDRIGCAPGEDTSQQPAVTVAANDEDIELTDVADEEEAAQAIQAADPDGDIELQANPVPVRV